MGNPVCVFLESEGLNAEDMQKIARWTNLSETTFVSRSEKADYKVRIFTPLNELPFAGHPTLGTAWALKAAGVIKKDTLVQECAFGLIHIQFADSKVFFELPHYIDQELALDAEISAAVGLPVRQGRLITTGPKWVVSELAVDPNILSLAIDPKPFINLMRSLKAEGITVYSIVNRGVINVRTFFESIDGIVEDPVCGSGNAAVGVHLMKTGKAGSVVNLHYEAHQGETLQRDGRVSVMLGDKIKVGGSCNVVLEGTAHIAPDLS